MKRLLSLLLAFALTFVLTPSSAFAAVTSGEEERSLGNELSATAEQHEPDSASDNADASDSTEGGGASSLDSTFAPLIGSTPGDFSDDPGALTLYDSHVNPEYADLPNALALSARSTVESSDEASRSDALALYPQFSSFGDAAEYLRACMIDREPQVTLRYLATSSYDPKDIFRQLLDSAMLEYTSSTVAGDYLLKHYNGSHCTMSGGGNLWSFVFDITYHTSASEEAATTSAVESLLNDLNVWYANDYEKVKAVHDWMVMNIRYDDYYANRTDYSPYSAYSAIVKRNTVCQGFGSLFYRLCKELGVNVRYISGWGQNESHGWNIVQLGDLWYNVDVTWDQNIGNNQWICTQFFLKSNAEFPDHTRDAEFNTSLFNQRYPMASTSFVPGVTPLPPSTESISGASVSGLQASYLFTGYAITPAVTVTLGGTQLTQGSDYTVSYANNTTRGTATVTISGIGNYHGSIQRAFQIEWNESCELFLDTPPGAWYITEGALGYIVDSGLMGGYGGDGYGTFGPEDPITRGQVAVILHRMAGEPSANGTGGFSDVSYGDYYREAVAWAKSEGIIEGYPDGTFAPNDPVQREQFVKMLGAYAELVVGMDVSSDCWMAMRINEWNLVSGWAQEYLGWAVDNGIMGGTVINGSYYLQPQATATRAQAAKMFMVFDRDVLDGYIPPEEPEPEPDPEPGPTTVTPFEENGFSGVVVPENDEYKVGELVSLDDPEELFRYYGPGAYVFSYTGPETDLVLPRTLAGATLRSVDVEFASVDTIDATGCADLAFLNCYGCDLTTLVVDGCAGLVELEAGGNALMALDVSSCTELESLAVTWNYLETLNLGTIDALTYLDVTGNSLDEIDVSGFANLETLDVSMNQIAKLDVSANTKLSYLDCSDNLLTGLDIAGLEKLVYLYCDDNYIADTSVLEAWLAEPGHEGKVTPQH